MPPVRLVLTLPGLLAAPDDLGPRPPRQAGETSAGRGERAGKTSAARRHRAAASTTPHLARLIAAAGTPRVAPEGTGAALASMYGIARQLDWPLAAIRLYAQGGAPGTAYWLAADPVTLVAGRDDVRLTTAVTDLAPEHAAALIATLNAHFAADAVEFSAPQPAAWFVRATAAQAMVTCPLEMAVGRTLRGLLPTGTDAGKWRRWQNEIQMLLHEHPVNQARERQGLPPANSVWFSGGGTCPPPYAATIATYAGGGIAAALAAHAGAPARTLPDGLADVLADLRTHSRGDVRADVLATGTGRATAVIALDPPLDLAAVERDWAAPAWAALARGTVEAVTMLADGDGRTVVWTALRPGRWERLAARLRSPELSTLLAAAPPAPAEAA